MGLTTRKQILDVIASRHLEARIDAQWSVVTELQGFVVRVAAKHGDPEFAALAVCIDDDLRAARPTP